MGSLNSRIGIHAKQFTGVSNLMNGFHIGDEAIIFRHVSNSLSNLGTFGGDVVAEDFAAPAGQCNESKNRLEKGRFSSTIWPK